MAALQRVEAPSTCSLATFDARLVVAEVLFEHNELDIAQAQLETALQLCRSAGAAHWAWAVEVDLVRVMIAEERPGDALNRLGHLRQLGLRNPPPHHLLQRFNDVQIACRLSLGDLEGALMVARSAHAGISPANYSLGSNWLLAVPTVRLARLEFETVGHSRK